MLNDYWGIIKLDCWLNDTTDFAEKIVSLFENKDMAFEFGKNARQLAVTKYEFEFLAEGLQVVLL